MERGPSRFDTVTLKGLPSPRPLYGEDRAGLSRTCIG